ncbi:MAG: hypothetical protein ACETWK_02580 [Candidatus Aminicenantaceae bacterium]
MCSEQEIPHQRLRSAGLITEKCLNTMTAFGYNFISNRILGYPRGHVLIPDTLALLFAQTLIVREKTKSDRKREQ